jgi:dienelactone hydrolase
MLVAAVIAASLGAAAFLAGGLSGCASQARSAKPMTAEAARDARAAMAVGFHFQAAASPGGGWVILLPGASGLKVFDDDQHYFRAAKRFNDAGFDALVVDYKAAYHAAPNAPDVETGDKIRWVIEQAVAWARESGKLRPEAPGAVAAWSLGAEGLWPLLNDRAALDATGLRAAVAFYPANEESVPVRTLVPLLILAGGKDDVTELKDIKAAVAAGGAGSGGGMVTLQEYPAAMHGFDIESISKPRKISLIPVIGPTATFGYNREAAEDARSRVDTFLRQHMR